MFFSVKERLTHVHLICFIISGWIKLKSYVTLVLRFGIVGREVVVGLESLVVRIDLLNVWSCLLQVKVYKTF